MGAVQVNLVEAEFFKHTAAFGPKADTHDRSLLWLKAVVLIFEYITFLRIYFYSGTTKRNICSFINKIYGI